MIALTVNDEITKEYLEKVDWDVAHMICTEEMGELLQAMSKERRDPCKKTRDNLKKEIGDVFICLTTLMVAHGFTSKDIQAVVEYKQARCVQRMNDGII